MTSSHPLKQEAQLSDKTSLTTANNNYMGRIGPGEQLQIARENARLTVQQVAAHMHLSPEVVTDIENDRFDKGIPFTFIRGYLRTFARLVNISPDSVVKAFDQLGLEDQRRAVRMPLKSVKRPMQLNETHYRWIIYVLLVAAVVGGLVWWFKKPAPVDPMQQDLMQLLNEINPPKPVGESQ